MRQDSNRRQFICTSAIAVTCTLAAGLSSRTDAQDTTSQASSQAQASKSEGTSSEDRPEIYSANKGGGFGKTREEMVTNLKKMKAIGYESLQPELKVEGVR